MGFQKGNKIGKGRKEGSKNKKPLARKEELEALFNENGGFDTLFESINAIEEPKDKANTLLKVMEYFIPKQKAIEHSGGENIIGLVQTMFTATGVKPITSENDDYLDD